MSQECEQVVIVGTGPAGLTAAIYAARAGSRPLVFAGAQHGGQLTTTTDVENFPGFAEGIMGPKLMQDMTDQAKRVGARVVYEEIVEVDFSSSPKVLKTSDSRSILAHTVILATGATAKTLMLAGEKELMGHGLSTCATCDGFFYRNKEVMVVGGGDSAMEEALYLADLASKVWLVHRRQAFRASHIMLKRAQEHKNITFLLPWVVSELVSENRSLRGVVLEKSGDTAERQTMTLDGLFYAIGHRPNSSVFLPFVDVDDQGYVKVHEGVKTKVQGVYAAGDLADPTFKQAITAAGMGCQAAMLATRYLKEECGS
ncbi:MAG: thioredoxin-disulfide reductase [Proteobacteria bacterium]|nr:thioredoxin-disulfide reductase [Pseudomonadota bacterium]